MMNKMFDLKNKVILITGGTGMLGTEYARTLASAGANIVLADLDAGKCEKMAEELERQFNNKMLGIKTDIRNKEEVVRMMQKIEEEFGRIDVLINNAAFNQPADKSKNSFTNFEDYPLELWKNSLDVNMTGAFLCTQESIRLMLKKKIKGSIINICSIYGLVAPDQRLYSSITSPNDKSKRFIKPADYSATKSAILNLTRYLAALYGEKGIRVNTLTLGGVFNGQDKSFVEKYSQKTPLKRMANKEDFNGAILFLSSDASKYMTGANLIVDGGWTCW